MTAWSYCESTSHTLLPSVPGNMKRSKTLWEASHADEYEEAVSPPDSKELLLFTLPKTKRELLWTHSDVCARVHVTTNDKMDTEII